MGENLEDRVLNPVLYRRLRRVFGDVKVVALGEKISWRIAAKYRDGRLIRTREVLRPGEEYMIRCPFCRDRLKRMSINHRWGVFDPEMGVTHWWNFNCFRRQCNLLPNAAERLYVMLFGSRRMQSLTAECVREGRESEKAGPILLPGSLLRLDRLPDDHPAVCYVRKRGFDPGVLTREFKVGYCEESRFALARRRLVFPIIVRRKLVGWQARYLGDRLPDGRTLKEAGIPKYFSCPGQIRRQIAFNYDRALCSRVIAIVEGPLDACRVGPYAMAVLGKTLSSVLQEQLVADIRRRWGDDAAIAVVLDPEQDEVSKRRGRPHHIHLAVQDLRKRYSNVFPVFLPLGTDPGSYPAERTRDLIEAAAARARVPLHWEEVSSGSIQVVGE